MFEERAKQGEACTAWGTDRNVQGWFRAAEEMQAGNKTAAATAAVRSSAEAAAGAARGDAASGGEGRTGERRRAEQGLRGLACSAQATVLGGALCSSLLPMLRSCWRLRHPLLRAQERCCTASLPQGWREGCLQPALPAPNN